MYRKFFFAPFSERMKTRQIAMRGGRTRGTNRPLAFCLCSEPFEIGFEAIALSIISANLN